MIRVINVVLIVGLSGCMTGPGPGYVGPQPISAEDEDSVAYAKTEINNSSVVVGYHKKYTQRRVTITLDANVIDEGPTVITIDYFDVNNAAPVPVILVLPTLGGDNKLANKFAKYFAENGLAAIVVHRQDEYTEILDLRNFNVVAKQMIINHRRVLDWLEAKPELDSSRVGIFGISMGGIKAALVAASDQRIKATVIALGGADLADMFMNSKLNGIVERRKEILESTGLNPENLQAVMSKSIAYDPLYFGGYIDAASTLLMISFLDQVVPPHNQMLLRKVIGKPRTIFIASGHFSSKLFMPIVNQQALAHFRRNLE